MSGSNIRYSNMLKWEWDVTRSLADDKNIFIKRPYKGSSVVIWDTNDYLLEADKQFHPNVSIGKEKVFSSLFSKKNNIIRNYI